MSKNSLTDYFDKLNPIDCPSSGCGGLTGRFVSSYPVITRIFTTGNNAAADFVSLTPSFTANVTVQGYNFLSTKRVFLSASDQTAISGGLNITNPLTSVDLFSSYSSISSTFTPFSGFEVTNFTVASDNTITFNVPSISTWGIDLHVIIVNALGHSLPFTEQKGRHPKTPTTTTTTTTMPAFWDYSYWTHSGLNATVLSNVNNGLFTDAAFHVDTAQPGSWLQLDAGTYTPNYTSVTINFQTGGGGSQSPNHIWGVEYSDDGASFTSTGASVDMNNTAPETATWSSVGSHRYWRIILTTRTGTSNYYSEVQFA